MANVDEIIYSDLFRRIYSRDVRKVLDTYIPKHKSPRPSTEVKKHRRFSPLSRMNDISSLMEDVTQSPNLSTTKEHEIPYKTEEIIDALLFVDSDLSTEKIFCLFTLAKQNFINRINRKPSTFSLTSLEERRNSVDSQRHIDYGRISFMSVNSQMGSTNNSISEHLAHRRLSQASQRSSISIEDPEASYNDKLEYLVDYILEVLLVIYPEKLRMILELEQCYPMYMRVLSAERNVIFMEQVLGTRLSFKSLEACAEKKVSWGRQSYRRRLNMHNAANKTDTSFRRTMDASDHSLFKKCDNTFFHTPAGSLTHGNSFSLPNSPLRYLKDVINSDSTAFKTKLKKILVDFVTTNVQPQARFHRTPCGRHFQKEPTSQTGLVQTVLLKVENQPQEKYKLSKMNSASIIEN